MTMADIVAWLAELILAVVILVIWLRILIKKKYSNKNRRK